MFTQKKSRRKNFSLSRPNTIYRSSRCHFEGHGSRKDKNFYKENPLNHSEQDNLIYNGNSIETNRFFN